MLEKEVQENLDYDLKNQNNDGSWSQPSFIKEVWSCVVLRSHVDKTPTPKTIYSWQIQ